MVREHGTEGGGYQRQSDCMKKSEKWEDGGGEEIPEGGGALRKLFLEMSNAENWSTYSRYSTGLGN